MDTVDVAHSNKHTCSYTHIEPASLVLYRGKGRRYSVLLSTVSLLVLLWVRGIPMWTPGTRTT